MALSQVTNSRTFLSLSTSDLDCATGAVAGGLLGALTRSSAGVNVGARMGINQALCMVCERGVDRGRCRRFFWAVPYSGEQCVLAVLSGWLIVLLQIIVLTVLAGIAGNADTACGCCW